MKCLEKDDFERHITEHYQYKLCHASCITWGKARANPLRRDVYTGSAHNVI